MWAIFSIYQTNNVSMHSGTKNVKGSNHYFSCCFIQLYIRFCIIKCFCAVYSTFPSSFNILHCYQVVQTSHRMRFYFLNVYQLNETHRPTIRTSWPRFSIFSIFALNEKKKTKQTNVKTAKTLPLTNKL